MLKLEISFQREIRHYRGQSEADYAMRDELPPFAGRRESLMSNERLYLPLTREARDRVVREFQSWAEGGCLSPKLEPSLLRLDWLCFVTREFPDFPDSASVINSPEFISYGFSALDAYATAMLAAHFSFRTLGALTFNCSLKRGTPDSALYLEFTATPERNRINPDSIMAELLRSFPDLLRTKGIETEAVFFRA